MSQLQPLWVTPEAAEALQRLVTQGELRVVGSGGITVRQSGGRVSIAAAQTTSGRPGGTPFTVAQITLLRSTDTIGVKLLDEDGQPTGEEFDVYVRAVSHEFAPSDRRLIPLLECSPSFIVGSQIEIFRTRRFEPTDATPTGEWIEGWWTLDHWEHLCEGGGGA